MSSDIREYVECVRNNLEENGFEVIEIELDGPDPERPHLIIVASRFGLKMVIKLKP